MPGKQLLITLMDLLTCRNLLVMIMIFRPGEPATLPTTYFVEILKEMMKVSMYIMAGLICTKCSQKEMKRILLAKPPAARGHGLSKFSWKELEHRIQQTVDTIKLKINKVKRAYIEISKVVLSPEAMPASCRQRRYPQTKQKIIFRHVCKLFKLHFVKKVSAVGPALRRWSSQIDTLLCVVSQPIINESTMTRGLRSGDWQI